MSPEQHPRVGIGVTIYKDGKVLLGKRKGSHGAGAFAFPGGHLEYMESFEGCARREVLEETGMQIKNVRFVHLLNLKEYAPKQYVHIGLAADWENGEPEIKEPEKVETWDWYDMENLPQPLFATTSYYVDAVKNGNNFQDA